MRRPMAGSRLPSTRTPVLKTGFPVWEHNFQWVGSRIRLEPKSATRSALSGNLRRLGVDVSGEVVAETGHRLVYRWVLDASKAYDELTGGGLNFVIDGTLAANLGLTTKPELLPDNHGWKWNLGNGQTIRVEFDPALPTVYFEQHNPYNIRAFLISKTLRPGRQSYIMTVSLPEDATVSAAPPMYTADTSGWYRNALDMMASPVDLSFLNDGPAGSHGFAMAKGDRIVFADGTPARFWGGTLAAYALYQDHDVIDKQCKRIAALGYNLIRIHHQDSVSWVPHTVIDQKRDDSQHLDEDFMEHLDYWTKCLKEHGVYVWLDLHVGRLLKSGDDVPGFTEIWAHNKDNPKGAPLKGYDYFNPRIEELMRDMNAKYLGHVNKYTGKAYKDDPAVLAVLLTNEDDLPVHYGNLMLPDKKNPYHNAIFNKAVKAYASEHGLPNDPTWRTWVPGPSKLFLADREAQWDIRMSAHLRSLGLKSMIATTQMFGDPALFALPSLTTGDVITVNHYDTEGFLKRNPRYVANFLDSFAMGQLADKPLAVTEWNVPYPARDRFLAPLYVASLAAFQGWDAMMIYNYSQGGFSTKSRLDKWSTYSDLAYTGLMPAAALIYRRGDVEPGKKHYVLKLDPRKPYYTTLKTSNLTTVRTLLEQSQISLALSAVKENPWLKATKIPSDAVVISDTDHDYLPSGQTFAASDTGQLKHDWAKELQTIDTARSQAVNGHVCGAPIALGNARFDLDTCYAAVDISSLDDAPINSARRVLITAVAQVVQDKSGILSEPVSGTISFKAAPGGALYALDGKGDKHKVTGITFKDGVYHLSLPVKSGTHWFLLETKD